MAFILRAARPNVTNTGTDTGADALTGRNLSALSEGAIPAVSVDEQAFVRRKREKLVLQGKPFYFAGFCNYYMLTRAADVTGTGRKEVVQTLQKAQELGMTVVRMWAFADGPDEWNGLQPALGMLDEDVSRNGLEWLVHEAPRYGMRLLLSLTNGDAGFGGMEQYVSWFGGANVTDFYTNPAIKAAFKRYVGGLVARRNSFSGVYFRDDPAILGWELANMPSNPGDDSGNVLQDWIDEMADYVKSLDANHLVTVGVAGWYGASTPNRLGFNPPSDNVHNPMAEWHHSFDAACLGTDYVRNQMGDNIDLMMLQVYPDSWLSCIEACKRDWTVRWIRSHFEDATKVGKPVVLGEFGKMHYGGMVQRREFMEAVYAEVEAWNANHGNVAGTFLWMVATDTYPDYDGLTIYTTKRASAAPQDKWPDLTVELLLQQQNRKEFLNWEAALRCMDRRAAGADSSRNPWVEGWNRTLASVAKHAQSLAAA